MKDKQSLVAKISGLFGFYALYVFLAGWTFLDVYFRSFGLDPRWISLASLEVPMKGVTQVLSPHGWSLGLIYITVFVLSLLLLLDSTIANNSKKEAAVALALVALLPMTFFASSWIGLGAAKVNRSDVSTLQPVSFTYKDNKFAGKVLFFDSGKLFVHDVQQLTGCASVGHAHIEILQVYRLEELSEIKIIEPILKSTP